MPYLNWKEAIQQRVNCEIGPLGAGEGKMRLKLSLEKSALDELRGRLEEVWGAGTSGELRLDLPGKWIVFWKKREGESRLLLAHPQADEWVATASLEASHAERALAGMADLASGQALSLGELVPTDKVSNVELVLVRL